jgi:hypothetical protein
LVHTSLTLSGSVAQYGRGVGIIQATAAQLITQFASCLKEKLADDTAPAASATASKPVEPLPPVASPPQPTIKPIAGFTLLARAIWARITRLFWRR